MEYKFRRYYVVLTNYNDNDSIYLSFSTNNLDIAFNIFNQFKLLKFNCDILLEIRDIITDEIIKKFCSSY